MSEPEKYKPSGNFIANGKNDFEKINKTKQLIALSHAAYGVGQKRYAQAVKDVEEIQQNPDKNNDAQKLFDGIVKVEIINEQLKTFEKRFQEDFGKDI